MQVEEWTHIHFRILFVYNLRRYSIFRQQSAFRLDKRSFELLRDEDTSLWPGSLTYKIFKSIKCHKNKKQLKI